MNFLFQLLSPYEGLWQQHSESGSFWCFSSKHQLTCPALWINHPMWQIQAYYFRYNPGQQKLYKSMRYFAPFQWWKYHELSSFLPFTAKSSGEQVLKALHHFLIYLPWYQSPLWASGRFPPYSSCLSVQAGCSPQGIKYLTGYPWIPHGLAEVLITLWVWTLWCVSNTNLNSRSGVTVTRPEDI